MSSTSCPVVDGNVTLKMWLLDTQSLCLRQVDEDSSVTKYAILSHTWDASGEVTFQDIQKLENARKLAGFHKIERTCSVARSKKIDFAWVDTCCIDKTSSAELSEAINSMFRWYRGSDVCYVYLSDFEPLPTPLTEAERREMTGDRLRSCRWFTRGWTLQELIASTRMEFFDRDWNSIGWKGDLEGVLSDITNVDVAILKDSSGLHSIPVARKMSWAVGRQTTRVEDRAYSLLGIFDTNLPLLYGEGSKAFQRLQHQIANENNDLSLFAWQHDDVPGTESPRFSGIFARSPDEFRHCATLKKHAGQFQDARGFAITNSGLRMEHTLHRLFTKFYLPHNELLLSLDCVETSARTANKTAWLGVRLTRVGNTYLRFKPASTETTLSRTAWTAQTEPDRPPAQWLRGPRDSSAPKHIFVRPTLSSSDVHRVSSLMSNTGIVLIFSPTVDIAGARYGLPAKCCDKGDLVKRTFTFHAYGRDNFLGIHFFNNAVFALPQDSSKGTNHDDKFGIVCALQWTGTSHQLRLGIFGPHALGLGGMTEESEVLTEVKDRLLVRYSDLSGLLVQSRMPQSAIAATSGWLSVQQIQESAVRQLPFAKWKEGYFHALVDSGERLGRRP